MDRVYESGAAVAAPTAPSSPSNGYPTAGNPSTATPATKPGPYFYHMIVEELMAVIAAGAVTPAAGTLTQVRDAILGLMGGLQGASKNLQASATGLSATVLVSADEIVVENGSNAYATLRSVSLTINTAVAGANGLDTGVLAGSTWYSVWVIYNGTIVSGLISTSATAPTMPNGYTYKARIGWIRTDASINKYPLSFKQYSKKIQMVVASGSNVATLPQMASGVAGSITTPAYVAVGTAGFIPSTASRILVTMAGATNGGLVAPNNSYGAFTSTTVPPPINLSESSSNAYSTYAEFSVESSNIYWASGVAGAALLCNGWEDNL